MEIETHMTKLFAASAYVAVMSLAIVSEGNARYPHRAFAAAPGWGGKTAAPKGDCATALCSSVRGETQLASLARTGPNETTATRAR